MLCVVGRVGTVGEQSGLRWGWLRGHRDRVGRGHRWLQGAGGEGVGVCASSNSCLNSVTGSVSPASVHMLCAKSTRWRSLRSRSEVAFRVGYTDTGRQAGPELTAPLLEEKVLQQLRQCPAKVRSKCRRVMSADRLGQSHRI